MASRATGAPGLPDARARRKQSPAKLVEVPRADPKVRRYDPAETRARVIDAAYHLFGTRGYASTGTADIAREADVSEGSIFYHFGSKRALLAELGRMHGQKMVEAMQGEDRIEDLEPGINIRRCFDFCEVTETWDRIVQQAAPCASTKHELKHTPEVEPFFNATREVVQTWVEAQLRAGFAKHAIVGIDPELAASMTFTVVGDALEQAMAPGVTAERKLRVREECVRFVRAACGFRTDID